MKRRHNPSEVQTKRKIGSWEISVVPGRIRKYVAYVDGPHWSDSGFIGEDGIMRWDFPERIPARVKETAYRMVRNAMKVAGQWPPRY